LFDHDRTLAGPIRPDAAPTVCHGKPVIRGLRYPVQVLLELLASGMSMEEVLAGYCTWSAMTCSRLWSSRR
jgi:hypothetical protein